MDSALQLAVKGEVLSLTKILKKRSSKSMRSSCSVEGVVHLSSLLQGKHKSDSVMIAVLNETNS